MSKRVVIIAGEASSDILAAQLVIQLKKSIPDLCASGMGGMHMQRAGVNIIVNNNKLAIVGFVEVLKNINLIRKTLRKMKTHIKCVKADLVILVDYPGFNLRIAKYASRIGCPVFYYVSPQIWAWHYSRIKIIKKHVNHMAVLFPFEEKIYQQENVPVTFVGHPLAESVQTNYNKDELTQQWGLNPNQPIIALLPGSRHSEISHLLPVMVETANKLIQNLPHAQFILPLAPNLTLKDLPTNILPTMIKVVHNQTQSAINCCDVAITASGTATLEIALLGKPMVIIYKASALNIWIAKKVTTRIKHFGLCNLVAEQPVAKELLQQDVTPENILAEVMALLTDKNYRQQTIENLHKIQPKLNRKSSSKHAAACCLELLQ